ncbi:hypothetical protein N0V83_010560 [Neocucurbitaria cava]|uniref:Uncharacterized protein n=1 Tax=Neocucurbitaria cava TaxID=798079 RepID=A0A9W8Y096_9PLEO|nr:hypothetical protein N0V83_010560 [Neocucurbitaria cava]
MRYPNRPAMTVADSPKKRKRALSPLPQRKLPIQPGEQKTTDMAPENKTATELFDEALGIANKDNAYDLAHAELLRVEEQDAWDRKAKPKPASESQDGATETRAAIIIKAIREYERKVVFGNLASEAIPGPDTRDMGGQFLTNKDRIDGESKLYEIAKMVPKGALLHLHFNAELHPELLLVQARDMKTMYIRAISPITSQKDLDETEIGFSVLDPDLVEPHVNIFSKDYPGDALNWKTPEWKWKVWMPWKLFRDEFNKQEYTKRYITQEDPTPKKEPTHCGAEPGHVRLLPAENWLKSKMVLSQEEAYGFTQTVNG